MIRFTPNGYRYKTDACLVFNRLETRSFSKGATRSEVGSSQDVEEEKTTQMFPCHSSYTVLMKEDEQEDTNLRTGTKQIDTSGE